MQGYSQLQTKTHARVRTRPWGNKDTRRIEGSELFDRLFVVFKHDKRGAQVTEVLAEVVCKAVIVVHNDDGAYRLSLVLLGCLWGWLPTGVGPDAGVE